LFLKNNDINSLKLIDFGLSTKYNIFDNYLITKKVGTFSYMAP